PAPPDRSPLSLHDALPICSPDDFAIPIEPDDRDRVLLLGDEPTDRAGAAADVKDSPTGFDAKQTERGREVAPGGLELVAADVQRSEEHTAELQSLTNIAYR